MSADTKTLLDATLESYVASRKKWIADQALASNTCINLSGSVVEWGDGLGSASKKITVAYNGWLDISGYPSGSYTLQTWTPIYAGQVAPSCNYVSFFLPVRAGQDVGLNCAGITSLRVRLWRAIGDS